MPTAFAPGSRARAARVAPFVVAATLVGGVARAQEAPTPSAPNADDAPPVDPGQEARQQYAAGVEAYAAKRYVEAALHFEAAAAHRPHAAALYNAALAWEQANRPERAADDFGRAAALPGLSAAQLQNAKGREATLERTMGTLAVTAPDGWRVQLDANTEAPTPAELHAGPGVHQLTIVAPDAPIRHRDVMLDLGKTTSVTLTPEAPAPPTPSPTPVAVAPEPAPPPPEEWWSARRAIGLGAAGLGAGFLVGGVVLGTSALSARDAYDAAPTRAAYDHANTLATWTDVSFVAGAVLIAGGAALTLWPGGARSDPPVSAGAPPAPKAGFELHLVPSVGGAVARGVF